MRRIVVLRIVARTAGVLLLIVLAAPWVWRAVTGDQFLTLTGTSMRPTYELGDILVVRQPRGDELTRPGLIVVAKLSPGDTYYVHRVWRTTDEGAVLKGDANEVPDPGPITQDLVVGTVRLHLADPWAQIYTWVQSLGGRLLIVALAALLIMGVPGRRGRPSSVRTGGPSQPTGEEGGSGG